MDQAQEKKLKAQKEAYDDFISFMADLYKEYGYLLNEEKKPPEKSISDEVLFSCPEFLNHYETRMIKMFAFG